MSAKTDWTEAARAEVKHENPLQQLQKKWGDWPIKPYYDAADVQQNEFARKLIIPYKATNGWFNLPLLDATSDAPNSLAIKHLNSGADGVVFRINASAKPQKLLADIKPEFCFLGFEAGVDSLSFFEQGENLLKPADKIYGCIFWDGDVRWQPVARLFKAYYNLRCFGIHVGTLSAENLESALQRAIALLDELTDNTFPAPEVLPKMAFSVESTSNFFLDVAMIRSLKILFQRLAQAYSVNNVPGFVRLVAQPNTSTNYDPHGSMIGGALSALGAVAASVDAITIGTENQNSNLHQHTARSISLLLKEESKLDKVSDPLAGSYFIENLTHTIVDKIWTKLSNA